MEPIELSERRRKFYPFSRTDALWSLFLNHSDNGINPLCSMLNKQTSFGETHYNAIYVKGLTRGRFWSEKNLRGERYKCAIQWILMKGSIRMLCCVFSISLFASLPTKIFGKGWKINNIVTQLWIYKLEDWYFIIIIVGGVDKDIREGFLKQFSVSTASSQKSEIFCIWKMIAHLSATVNFPFGARSCLNKQRRDASVRGVTLKFIGFIFNCDGI